jgi:serine/threonine protein kinase
MAGKRPHWLGRNHRYRLVSVIAEDPLGSLWRAENAMLSEPVTARVVRESLGSDPEFVHRLQSEVDRVSQRLSHPNVAAVFSYNWGDDGPVQFVVMEAVEGQPLADALGHSQGLDPERSVGIAVQVTEALQAAHEAGVIHGALRPTNVMITPMDRVKVLDFGLGAAAWDRPGQVSRGGDPYLPPEWVLGAKRRPSWDTYTVAVLLRHMLTGTPAPSITPGSPNGSRAPGAEPVEGAAGERTFPGLSVEAARVWSRALARDPRDRPAIGELVQTLREPVPGRARRRHGKR